MANQFLPFGTDVAANVMSQADYAAADQRTEGQQPGLALSELNNKALRQANTITSQFAQFMADRLGQDVLDNGQTGDILTQIVALFNTITPTGTMLHYSGSAAPVGFLLCYGQAVSRTTYAALFAITGTAFGVGDGSTTFNLPDLRGRVLAGIDNMGTVAANRLTGTVLTPNGNTMGATGGTQTHTLTTGEMPSHTHTQDAHTHTQDAHTHTQNSHNHGGTAGGTFMTPFPGGSGDSGGGAASFAAPTIAADTATNQNTTATNQNTTATNQNTGGDGAHLNTQPTMIVNVIIKT